MSTSAGPDCSTGACPPVRSTADPQLAPVGSSSTISTTEPTADTQAAVVADPDPLLDASTFITPRIESTAGWRVVIEFCDRCRWLHRAAWVQTELFLTFPPPALSAISLIPLNTPETGGRFRVWLFNGEDQHGHLVWDRKIEGGFPELKLLKQRIRNLVSPAVSLGHSDKTSGRAEA